MFRLYAIVSAIVLTSCYNPINRDKAILTPIRNTPLHEVKIVVPRKYAKEVDIEYPVYLPAGYTAKIFYAGKLDKARFMAWGPDSVLHIANKKGGYVLALPDKNHDGEADTAIVVAKDLHLPHDIKFYKGAMYVAEERKILKLLDNDNDGVYESQSVFIDSIAQGAQQPGGGHDTRTIVFDEKNKLMYLSIGSSCNACRENERAIIEVYNDDGTNRKLYANGVRNAIGMALHPVTGKLWATNNGSDWQGDDIPPEWVDEVSQGSFYGHPLAWGNQQYFDFSIPVGGWNALKPITRQDSLLVQRMKVPAAFIQAHSALMAIEFPSKSVGHAYTNGAFVALRGSWNRKVPTGYKVVYVHIANNHEVEYISDFLTGFASKDSEVWARPVGLETDSRGNLYVGSDANEEFILIVSRSDNSQ